MIKFKFDPLDKLGTRLERAAERGRLALAAVDAVNVVTKRADEALRRGEIKDINLTPAYVKSKTDMKLAVLGSGPARAEIVTKGDPTILGRFAPLSRLVDSSRKDRIGRALGRRSAGTRVAILKSKVETQKDWFIMRLRAGNGPGNNFGVFVRDPRLPAKNGPNASLAGGRHRDGKAGKRHIYGPAPYQLFKRQIDVQSNDIRDDLARTALTRLGDALEEAL